MCPRCSSRSLSTMDDELEDKKSSKVRSNIFRVTVSTLVAVLLFVIGIVNVFPFYDPSRRTGPTIQDESLPCKNPAIRREWRTLDNVEKHNYLKSVQCLWEQPSVLGLNHSLHEDFPWVHSRVGNFCRSSEVCFVKNLMNRNSS